jgi:peroxiredoxin
MARLAKEFGERGVQVLGVYSDPEVNAEVARTHAKEYGLAFPGLLDPEQKLGRAIGIRVTPEVAVLSPAGAVLYHGRIDDRYPPDGKRREKATTNELRDTLQAVLNGKPVPLAETKAFGCPLPKLARSKD